jgi:hypothetical protein
MTEDSNRKLVEETFAASISKLEQDEARTKSTHRRAKGRNGVVRLDHYDETRIGAPLTPNVRYQVIDPIETEFKVVPKQHRTRRSHRELSTIGGALPAEVFGRLQEIPDLWRDVWKNKERCSCCARVAKVIGVPVTMEGARRAAFIAIIDAIRKRDGIDDVITDSASNHWWALQVLSFVRAHPRDRRVKELGAYDIRLGEQFLAEFRGPK